MIMRTPMKAGLQISVSSKSCSLDFTYFLSFYTPYWRAIQPLALFWDGLNATLTQIAGRSGKLIQSMQETKYDDESLYYQPNSTIILDHTCVLRSSGARFAG